LEEEKKCFLRVRLGWKSYWGGGFAELRVLKQRKKIDLWKDNTAGRDEEKLTKEGI